MENTEVAVKENELFSGLPEEILANLSPAKLQVISLFLTGNYTKKRIGQIVGISPNTVNGWLLRPEIQKVITELQKRELALVQANLNSLRNKAVETMEDLLNSNMDNVRFSAAKDILDRTGLKVSQEVKVHKTVTNLEQQLSDLNSFNFDDKDVIDVDLDEMISEVKSGGR